ncbi:tetratricopeptide repeat protein [bacterium]|nr:tetratricopeptide repeat protein [bacterium]
MKKTLLLILILMVSVISTACINNLAVQELNNKAKEYMDKGDYQNAIGRFKSSIDLDSTIFETHYNLGIAYTQAEEYADAIDAFEDALKINPDYALAYYSIAVAYENAAKDIINPPKKDDDDDDDDDLIDDTKKELSVEQKSEIVDLFTKSIDSYQTYLEKEPNSDRKEEVSNKIEYLQKEVEKYS